VAKPESARHRPAHAISSSTGWEQQSLGVDKPSDGHARWDLPVDIEGRLSEIWRAAQRSSLPELQRNYRDAFAWLSRQSMTAMDAQPNLQFSASIAFDIVGAALHEMGARTAAITYPTFDNLRALWRRRGFEFRSRAPSDITSGTVDLAGVDALVAVVPNNPTGEVFPSEAEVQALVRRCGETDTALVLDMSFRFHVPVLADIDIYQLIADAVKRNPNLKAAVLEDTGKWWATDEMKVAMVHATPALRPAIARASDDLILQHSKFELNLLTELMLADIRRVKSGRLPLPREYIN
jgi:hypothetical protein